MPPSPLRVSDLSEQDLSALCEQPVDKLEEAYSRLAAIKQHIVSPKALRATLNSSLPAGVSLSLSRQLISLQTYVSQSQKDPVDVIFSLTLGLEKKGWGEEVMAKWRSISSILQKFLLLDHISVVSKALSLSFDFEHILSDANIFTDIRPVYTAKRDEIAGAIICNRLRIRYQDEDGSKSLSISIDKDEIERLQKCCADTLSKIELATRLMKDSQLEAFITGDEENDI